MKQAIHDFIKTFHRTGKNGELEEQLFKFRILLSLAEACLRSTKHTPVRELIAVWDSVLGLSERVLEVDDTAKNEYQNFLWHRSQFQYYHNLCVDRKLKQVYFESLNN